jgi:hypothetical protein
MDIDARFIQFEKEVMEKILVGCDDKTEILRCQYQMASVNNREFSGVGFFTSFSVPENCLKLPRLDSFHLGGVSGEINGISNGVGFVLFIEQGVIHMLEGYTYGDQRWPRTLVKYNLKRL